MGNASSPPEEALPIPDLRTVGGIQVAQPSTELRDVLQQVLQQQAWYKDYQRVNGEEPLSFIGQFNLDSKVEDVVASIRQTLDVGLPQKGSWEDYFRELIQGAERAGIMVMRSGIVGSNTHRKLQVTEFRGFAISDSLAPLIFINSADAATARLFTLMHELAHLWLGSTGISNAFHSEAKEEVFCNAVAGEYLVPKNVFSGLWNSEESVETNAQEIAPNFHVSRFVVVRRALDCGFITQKAYNDFYTSELKSFREKGGSGGDYYRTAGAKNSYALSTAVITETLSGRMLMRDAGKLLGLSPNSIRTYARKLSL